MDTRGELPAAFAGRRQVLQEGKGHLLGGGSGTCHPFLKAVSKSAAAWYSESFSRASTSRNNNMDF